MSKTLKELTEERAELRPAFKSQEQGDFYAVVGDKIYIKVMGELYKEIWKIYLF